MQYIMTTLFKFAVYFLFSVENTIKLLQEVLRLMYILYYGWPIY